MFLCCLFCMFFCLWIFDNLVCALDIKNTYLPGGKYVL